MEKRGLLRYYLRQRDRNCLENIFFHFPTHAIVSIIICWIALLLPINDWLVSLTQCKLLNFFPFSFFNLFFVAQFRDQLFFLLLGFAFLIYKLLALFMWWCQKVHKHNACQVFVYVYVSLIFFWL